MKNLYRFIVLLAGSFYLLPFTLQAQELFYPLKEHSQELHNILRAQKVDSVKFYSNGLRVFGYSVDTNGRFTHKYLFTQNDQVVQWTQYTHDQRGHLLQQKGYMVYRDSVHQIKAFMQGTHQQPVLPHEADTIVTGYENRYDENGNKVYELRTGYREPGDTFEIQTSYDESRHLQTENLLFVLNGQTTKRTDVYRVDSTPVVVRKALLNDDGTPSYSYHYRYDPQARLLEEKQYDFGFPWLGDSVLREKKIYSYGNDETWSMEEMLYDLPPKKRKPPRINFHELTRYSGNSVTVSRFDENGTEKPFSTTYYTYQNKLVRSITIDGGPGPFTQVGYTVEYVFRK